MPVKGSNSRKVQIFCYVEPEMQAWLSEQAENKGESFSTYTATLLLDARHQLEEPEEAMAAKLGIHLDRMNRTIRDLVRENRQDHKFMEEMFASYVRVYLNHAPIIPDERIDEIERNGGVRFGKFLKYLMRNYSKHSLLTEVREAQDVNTEGSQHDQ